VGDTQMLDRTTHDARCIAAHNTCHLVPGSIPVADQLPRHGDGRPLRHLSLSIHQNGGPNSIAVFHAWDSL
jgi:hypothetical protein